MRYKIKDVAKINERAINKKYNGTINYIDTSSVTDNIFNNPKVYSSIKEAPSRARRVVNLGDTIISTVRPNMKHTGFIDKVKYKNCIYSTGFAVVTPLKDRVDPFYLYLVLTNNKNTELLQSIGETSTSTYPSVKPSDIENLEHDFPNINKQKEISTIIKMLENKIYLNNKINTNLFGLSETIFNNILEEETIKLSEITTIQNGYAFKSSEYIQDEQLMVLRTKNIGINNLFSKDDVVYISKENLEKYSKFSFKQFDTVIVMVGASIGRTGFLTSNIVPSLQNQNMWRFRPLNSKMPGLILYQYINYINTRVKNSASGSARSFYTKKIFNEFDVPRINTAYYKTFSKLQEQIDNLSKETEELKKIKSILLNEYF